VRKHILHRYNIDVYHMGSDMSITWVQIISLSHGFR